VKGRLVNVWKRFDGFFAGLLWIVNGPGIAIAADPGENERKVFRRFLLCFERVSPSGSARRLKEKPFFPRTFPHLLQRRMDVQQNLLEILYFTRLLVFLCDQRKGDFTDEFIGDCHISAIPSIEINFLEG
jgi:hypothetical protein